MENPSLSGFLSNPSHPGVRSMTSEESNMVTIAADDRSSGSTAEDDEKVRLIANFNFKGWKKRVGWLRTASLKKELHGFSS